MLDEEQEKVADRINEEIKETGMIDGWYIKELKEEYQVRCPDIVEKLISVIKNGYKKLTYTERVLELEKKGCSTGDAQGIADVELMKGFITPVGAIPNA